MPYKYPDSHTPEELSEIESVYAKMHELSRPWSDDVVNEWRAWSEKTSVRCLFGLWHVITKRGCPTSEFTEFTTPEFVIETHRAIGNNVLRRCFGFDKNESGRLQIDVDLSILKNAGIE